MEFNLLECDSILILLFDNSKNEFRKSKSKYYLQHQVRTTIVSWESEIASNIQSRISHVTHLHAVARGAEKTDASEGTSWDHVRGG